MNRRELLILGGAATLVPAGAWAGIGAPYRDGMVKAALSEGKTVFLDFFTDWCSTCRAQERTIGALLGENPAYEEAITFIAVDWDVHAKSDLAQRLAIPRRSTLVALKGDQELGRIVAGTRKADIKALLDKALAAAVA